MGMFGKPTLVDQFIKHFKFLIINCYLMREREIKQDVIIESDNVFRTNTVIMQHNTILTIQLHATSTS